jgi:hypothetical protein
MQLSVFLTQEDKTPLRVSEAQGSFQESLQDVLHYLTGVQLACRFQKQIQDSQVRAGCHLFPAGQMAQELPYRSGGRAIWIEHQAWAVRYAEVDAVVARQLAPVDAFSVHKRAALGALIDDVDTIRFLHQLGMLT